MPATYEPIATTTLGSAASSITFSSIPGTYTDLRIVFVGTASTGTTSYLRIRFNDDASNNYSGTRIVGNGSTVTSVRQSDGTQTWITNTALSDTQPSLGTIDIFSYAGSTNKTCLSTASQDANGSGIVSRWVNLWRSTSAITKIEIATNDGTWSAGTTATLYGIKSF